VKEAIVQLIMSILVAELKFLCANHIIALIVFQEIKQEK